MIMGRQVHELPASGTFRVYDPGTKMISEGSNFQMLYDNVCRKRYALGVPMGLDMRAEVEKWVCEANPADCGEVDLTIPRKRRMDLSDVIRGTKVMMSFVANGRQVVSREVAEKRAQICLNCEFNQIFPKPCPGICGELQAVVQLITGNQGTQYDSRLHSCGICGCFLQAALWIPMEVQDKGLTDVMRAQFKSLPHCWKKLPADDTSIQADQ